MHVEHEIAGGPVLEDPQQQQASQERLACAGLSEHPVAALDQLLDVQAQARLHIQRVADKEMVLVLLSKDDTDVVVGGRAHGGEVRRDGLGRLWAVDARDVVAAADGKHRLDSDGPIRGGAGDNFGDEGVGHVGRRGHHCLIHRFECNFSHHSEESHPLALDAHEGADLDVLNGGRSVQPYFHALGQRAGDDHAQVLGRRSLAD